VKEVVTGQTHYVHISEVKEQHPSSSELLLAQMNDGGYAWFA
jgi:hypothetical protein